MDALQAATSALAIAELARRTALLIRRVCNARKDAEALCKKTQNLSHLLEHIGRILNKRRASGEDRAITTNEQPIEKTLEASLKLCEECLEQMHSKFKDLVENHASLSKIQFRKSLKFVRNNRYIADREKDINMHLSHLSLAFQCLSHEELAAQRRDVASEAHNREQAAQNQLDMQEAFLRQLFTLFQYVFQQAAAASSAGPDNQEAPPHIHQPSEQLGQQDQRASIGNVDPQPSLQNIFGASHEPQELQQQFRDYMFESNRVEEVNETEDSSLNVVEIDFLAEDAVEQELARLDETLSSNMPQYTNDTTFLLAIKQGNKDLVQNLLNEGADTTAIDSYGWTILHHAVFCLREDVVNILLDHERSQCRTPQILNAQSETGETALIYAVQRADKYEGFNIAERLLTEDNCDVNISDGRGSALYYAVNEGRPSSKPRQSLVQSIVETGADVQAVHEKVPESTANYKSLVEHMDKLNVRSIESRRRSGSHESQPAVLTQRSSHPEDITEGRGGEASSEHSSRLSQIFRTRTGSKSASEAPEPHRF